MRLKRLRRPSHTSATSAASIGKEGRSCRLHRQSRAAEVAARFLVASEERTSLAKSLARTLADTHIVEQRLKDMRLLHQRIEDQNKQLRLILALHKSILDAQQATRQYEGSCSKGEKDISP
ncbi:g3849 [Coccomyxa viridis]|uniref:G3849 protein n=1 Tax=Coccomyxa viridis TaxID=1274662 RepID=A0ABP1FNW0_9CHLO